MGCIAIKIPVKSRTEAVIIYMSSIAITGYVCSSSIAITGYVCWDQMVSLDEHTVQVFVAMADLVVSQNHDLLQGKFITSSLDML